MIVNKTIITPAQHRAGVEAMRGTFIPGAVIHALRDAGVSTKDGLVAVAARRLIAKQIDAGRVKRVGGKFLGAAVH